MANTEYIDWGMPNPPRWKTPDPFSWTSMLGGLLTLIAFGFMLVMVAILVTAIVVTCIAVPPVGIGMAKAVVGGS